MHPSAKDAMQQRDGRAEEPRANALEFGDWLPLIMHQNNLASSNENNGDVVENDGVADIRRAGSSHINYDDMEHAEEQGQRVRAWS